MNDLLHLHLGGPDTPVELGMVGQLDEHLRGALRELAREEGIEGKVGVRLEVRELGKRSVVLDVAPRLEGAGGVEAGAIVASLIEDMESLAADAPRPTMGTGLLGHCRALVGLARKAGGLSLRYGDRETLLGPEREVALRAALRDEPEPETVVVGTIETVNIHARPWRFGLYTKLDRERVECPFDEAMLDGVLALMERKTLVEIRGEAQYGPVGATPRTIVLDVPPEALAFDPEALLAFRRSADLTRAGEDAVAAIGRVREDRAPCG